MTVRVTFVGSGDAFGSGGRFQTCILVDAPGIRFAIDFGASSLIALNKFGIDHNSIDAIVLTHFHGDHAGGTKHGRDVVDDVGIIDSFALDRTQVLVLSLSSAARISADQPTSRSW